MTPCARIPKRESFTMTFAFSRTPPQHFGSDREIAEERGSARSEDTEGAWQWVGEEGGVAV